jgi:hypothetical protein
VTSGNKTWLHHDSAWIAAAEFETLVHGNNTEFATIDWSVESGTTERVLLARFTTFDGRTKE